MVRGPKASNKEAEGKKFSRRRFVAGGGVVLAGGALSSCTAATAAVVPAKTSDYSQSSAYLVYDSRQCAGCQSCMLACSLVHEGEASLSLARIQVSRSVLTRYPYDIQIAVCRQCPEPLCVANCPTGACHIDTSNGNVRRTDESECIGCQTCLKSCPFPPHRTVWKPAANKATKCDLCTDSPHFSKPGGPSGQQACVVTCPMGALKVVHELPLQTDISGYDVNLAPPPPQGQFGPPGAKPKGSAKTTPRKQ
ncbi:MAG: 4Fe-4S dicluster domain-containing protein [Acidobacteriota bacterium]